MLFGHNLFEIFNSPGSFAWMVEHVTFKQSSLQGFQVQGQYWLIRISHLQHMSFQIASYPFILNRANPFCPSFSLAFHAFAATSYIHGNKPATTASSLPDGQFFWVTCFSGENHSITLVSCLLLVGKPMILFL